jgi:hypothetical protein
VGFVVYSVGPDLTDDAGTLIDFTKSPPTGDLVWRCDR